MAPTVRRRSARLHGAAVSRVSALNQRYMASESLVRTGVRIIRVGDPAGARFNVAVRRLAHAARDEGSEFFEELLGTAKALRWRRITAPQPIIFNEGLCQLAEELKRQALGLRGAVADENLLVELADAGMNLLNHRCLVYRTLQRVTSEAGPEKCVVVAANKRTQVGLTRWLAQYSIPVLTGSELGHVPEGRDQAYVLGPPRFFRTALVTAPPTNGVTFLVPAWFSDLNVPCSGLAAYAEGAVRIKAKVFSEGDTAEPLGSEPLDDDNEDDYLPQPVWGKRQSEDREPANDEVVAHKVLLSGGLAMWLDDGERIRSVDPQQPLGERVTYTEVPAVRVGTYLLLRQGSTERSALYQAAIAKLGQRGSAVEEAQAAWKAALASQLQLLGYKKVVGGLRGVGIRTAERARAWTDPSLIRPHSDHDFEQLLQWLCIPVQPTFGYATWLRKTLYQVSAEVGKQLEAAVSAADLTEMEEAGHLSLEVATDGFRGVLATRVLGISPHSEIVSRHDARVPFEDRSAQWLE